MSLQKVLSAWILDELPSIAAHVFLGVEIGEWLRL
jgi:hypothetical protein